MIHLMLKYIPYRLSLNKVIIILNQATTYTLILSENTRPTFSFLSFLVNEIDFHHFNYLASMDLLIWIIEHSAGVKYEIPSTIDALKSNKYLAQSLKSTFFKVIVPQMEKGVCWEKQNSWKKSLILASKSLKYSSYAK